jgi:hypothetical protein
MTKQITRISNLTYNSPTENPSLLYPTDQRQRHLYSPAWLDSLEKKTEKISAKVRWRVAILFSD